MEACAESMLRMWHVKNTGINAFIVANIDRVHLMPIISPITKAILLLIFLRVPAASLRHINIIINSNIISRSSNTGSNCSSSSRGSILGESVV